MKPCPGRHRWATGDGPAPELHDGYGCAGLLLRSTKSLAARLERKYERAIAAIPAEENGSVLLLAVGEEGTHIVQKVDPNTGAATTLYTFAATNFENYTGGYWTFNDNLSVETVIPDTTGVLFIQDKTSVNLFQLSTGTQIGTTITLDDNTSNGVDAGPPYFGRMIVAGDGNAYVPYVYYTDAVTAGGGVATTHRTSHLMALRVSPDGSSAKVPIKELSATIIESNSGTDVSGSYYFFPPGPPPMNYLWSEYPSVITNGGTGAAVLVPAPICDYCTPQAMMTFISQDSVTAQASLPLQGFLPALQREDGSYIGNDTNNGLDAIGMDGTLLWQNPAGAGGGVAPLYATTDAGLIVTSTVPGCVGGDIVKTLSYGLYCQLTGELLPNPYSPQGQLGTLYTLDQYGNLITHDQSGNIISPVPDTGARPSWTNNWYADAPGTISNFDFSALDLAQSWWSILRGNASSTGVAIPQQPFPPLDSCTSSPGCIGRHEAIYNALRDLIARLSNPGIFQLAQDNVFRKLGPQYQTGTFLTYLRNGPGFFDGVNSTYCYNSLTGELPWACLKWPRSLTHLNLDQVKTHFAIDGTTVAIAGTPSAQLLVFFRPSSIGFGNLGRNLGNEGLIWYEALHGFAAKFDQDLESIFHKDASCRITLDVLDGVLSTTASGLAPIDPEIQWNTITNCGP